jgi:hypothetical protein
MAVRGRRWDLSAASESGREGQYVSMCVRVCFYACTGVSVCVEWIKEYSVHQFEDVNGCSSTTTTTIAGLGYGTLFLACVLWLSLTHTHTLSLSFVPFLFVALTFKVTRGNQ